MNIANIRLKQAQWLIDILSPEQLVAFACQILEADVDSPCLRRLAGETNPTKESIRHLAGQTFLELGLDPLNQEQAVSVVAGDWAKKIVAGEASPYDGAKAIWRECCDIKGSGNRLDVFLSLASEHEDFLFARPGCPEMYDRLIRECEDRIVREAQLLLDEDHKRN